MGGGSFDVVCEQLGQSVGPSDGDFDHCSCWLVVHRTAYVIEERV